MASVFSDASSFEWIQGTTPLSSPMWMVIAWIIYAVTVFVIKKSADARPSGYSNISALTAASAIHNLVLAVWSGIMFVGTTKEIYRYAQVHGMQPIFCTMEESAPPTLIYYWMYIFYFSKYYELLDTVIIASRKRPLTLLHLWHHSSVMLETWLWMEGRWAHASLGAWFNTLVHIFMYSYFFAAVLKIKVPWRRYITQLQIVQFISSFVLTVPHLVLQLQTGWKCYGRIAFGASAFINFSYLVLFIRFYRSTYNNSDAKKDEKKAK